MTLSGTVFFIHMEVLINGEKREFQSGISVAQLLEELKVSPGRVVVELNRNIVPRESLPTTLLSTGDTIEIVHFVGGG